MDVTWEENLCVPMFDVEVVKRMPIRNPTAKVTFLSFISAVLYHCGNICSDNKNSKMQNLSCFVELDESLMSGWAGQRDR